MIISDASIKYRTAVFAATVICVIGGIYSYARMPRENFPDITVPYVFISTRYEGVAPEEIENLVTIHMEKKLKSLDKVKEISSSSIEEFSNITIEFYPDQDIDDAVQKVKDKIDLAREDMPDDIDEPVVSEVNLSTDIPIMTVAFHGAESLAMLKKIVEDIKDRIETVPGVLEAGIFGDREREIRVEVDIGRLNAYGVDVPGFIRRITNENSTVSAGNIDMLGGKFQIRIPGEFATPAELDTLIISVKDGRPLYLTDFARVIDTYKDLTTTSSVNGVPCVSLMIQKRSGENIIRVINDVKRILEEERRKLPADVVYTVTSDMSKDTYQMLWELENNLASGFVLVVLVLFFAMGARNSLMVGIAIPMSLLIAFMLLSALSVSLNMIVLFSLILALGMLVDNGIVIVENIYRHKCEGMDAETSARRGASEVAWPVTTSTLTTLAAFFPLLSWPDVIGEFMSYLPETVIVTLSASLFVGIVINPAFCSLLVKERSAISKGMLKYTDRLGSLIFRSYSAVLGECLHYPGLVAALSAMLFIFVCIVYFRFNAGVELFPESDPRRAVISLKFPEGTEIARTCAMAKGIEERLRKYSDISYFLTTVGRGGGSFFKGGDSGPHLASVQIEFLDFEKRKYHSDDLTDAIRININGYSDIDFAKGAAEAADAAADLLIEAPQRELQSLKIFVESMLAHSGIAAQVRTEANADPQDLARKVTVSAGPDTDRIIGLFRSEKDGFPGAEVTVDKEKEGPPTGAAIMLEVSGDDFDVLAVLAEKLKSEIAGIPGLADLRDDYEDARPELRFVVDRKRAALLNLDTGTIATFIRTAINGMEVSKYREGEDEYDITIRLPESQRLSLDSLLQMEIPIPGKGPLSLSNLGTFEYSKGYGTIRRKNHDRTITVEGDVKPGYASEEVLQEVMRKIAGYPLPSGYRIKYRGEHEDQQENFEFLLKAFFIGVSLIAIILILQFNSVLLPMIIMTSVVLSFIGTFGALLAFDMRFSIIMTGLGVICLAGVVVNNSIVLIDCILLQKSRGMSAFDAAFAAGRLRFRPVMLTAVTTILGLIPMAVGWSVEIHQFPPKFIAGAESSQWWAPMAIVVIFGLGVSTLLTLILAPCLFVILDRLQMSAGLRTSQFFTAGNSK